MSDTDPERSTPADPDLAGATTESGEGAPRASDASISTEAAAPAMDGSPRLVPVAEIRSRLTALRPDLTPDSPEFQAALLLLQAQAIGPNVDRLVRRTRLPRELVARCLRRLVDNACFIEGRLVTSWGEDPLTCRDFWRDVEVALGRRLRRLDPSGRPEWAPLGGWVKDFNYRAARSTEETIHAEYYEIPEHDPEPAETADEHGEEEERSAVGEDVVEPPRIPSRPRREVPPRAAPSPPAWLGILPPSETKRDPLINDWNQAKWLG